MSVYTTELRFICECEAGLIESEGYNSISQIIENSREKIFNFDYPIFDETYRSVLETKILKHFYTEEICEETYGLWKLRLDSKMNEIMPYYNQLYKSTLIEFNPLYNMVVETTHHEHNDNSKFSGTHGYGIDNSGTHLNDKNKEYNKYSDTPQGALTNVENDNYLTNARIIEDNRNAQSKKVNLNHNSEEERTFVRDTNKYVEIVQGNNGDSFSKRVIEFRNTFINIDKMIISELEPLFMQIW